ncbi:MAG TPA: hypothetical protein VD772_00310, partial [Anseongella sp.]|nr:hypothetical protein [Anseongella sp.]
SVLDTGLHLFGQKTTEYIDAGETSGRRYMSFLCPAEHAADKIEIADGGSRIKITQGMQESYLDTAFKDFL